MLVKITADGSVLNNPGIGGWAAIFRLQDHCKCIYGWEQDSTNNRMELMAAIRALEHLKRGCDIRLYSDSEYLIKGISLWIKGWKKRGWMTKEWKENTQPKPIKNPDLWQRLDLATQRHTIQWQWVRGHNQHEDNLLCDEIARRAARMQVNSSTNGIVLSDAAKIIPGNTPREKRELIRAISFDDV